MTTAESQSGFQMLTMAEVASRLRVSSGTVRRLIAEGMLPGPIYLTARCPRWSEREIELALKRQPSLSSPVDPDLIADQVANEFRSKARSSGRRSRR